MEKSRNFVSVAINHQEYKLSGSELFVNLTTFLREKLYLTATKVACEEGDCGACTVMIGVPYRKKKAYVLRYHVVNACIIPMFSLDARHIITLEGLNSEKLLEIQQQMLDKGGAQCGFCTPGMIVSLVDFFENHQGPLDFDYSTIKEKLKGNLCRCTGYQAIINAALSIKREASKNSSTFFSQHYSLPDMAKTLGQRQKDLVRVHDSHGNTVCIANTLKKALRIKKQNNNLQLCAGTTDLGVQWNKSHTIMPYAVKSKVKKHSEEIKVLSLHKISSLYKIEDNKSHLILGAQVSIQQIQDYIKENLLTEKHVGQFYSFYQILERFASPAIKNRATLSGNIANASPVGDSIPFLMVTNAKIELQRSKKYRLKDINHFFKAYKKLAIHKNEIITRILIPKLKEGERCLLYKVSQRYDLDISCVSAAFLIKRSSHQKIRKIKIAFGGIGPYVIRLKNVEKKMKNSVLSQTLINEAVSVALADMQVISDIRGSALLRQKLVENLFQKFYLAAIE